MARTKTTFFTSDTEDGRTRISSRMPISQDAIFPKTIAFLGPRSVPPPDHPLTAEEFDAWCRELADQGYSIEMSSVTARGMKYLHREFDLGPGDAIEVAIDHPANVQFLDPMNFAAYQRGMPYRYRGGYLTDSPYIFHPPHPGRWHLVVDLGGNVGTVRAEARLAPGQVTGTSS